ncbi:MAG TPA: glucosaminidase domain-containing protein [Chloroflexota bacterium]
MAIDFRSDPLGQRTKGWKVPPYTPKTRLVPGWEPRPEYGAGQELMPGALEDALFGPTAMPVVPLVPPVEPEPEPQAPPYDWSAQRAQHFPDTLGPPPAPRPPDPGVQRHLGTTVAPAPAPVYPPSQARTLSTPAPTPAHRPPAQPPTASQSASAAAAPGGAGPRSPSQQAFIDQMLPKAQAMGRQTGIPWQVLIAIPANETGWGSAVFHNNYFGIKGAGAPARTWEVVNGQRQDITDSFRTFDSAEASMKGFAELMNNPRYQPAMAQLQKDPSNWPAFVSMIHTAGYATDPAWAQKVISIGQRLESSDSQPVNTMSTVTPTGSVIDTARSAVAGNANPNATPNGKQVSQFGDPTLSAAEAYAACGPAAAVRFAQVYGRNPTLREATNIAATVGWNQQQGMAGIGSEQKLLDKLGIPTRLVGPSLDAMVREASTGNPVVISTPGHYFYADGYNSQTGAFHVGQSGLDLKGGSEWMTPAQIEARMGKIQGALLADNPSVSGGSTTAPRPSSFPSDASFVAWSYRNGLGKNLPSTIGALYTVSNPIRPDQAQPGDLVMFNLNSRDPSQRHVGIYAGNGEMVHTVGAGGQVEQVPLWAGGEFRRLTNVKADDLNRAPSAAPSPSLPATPRVTNPIIKYRDNGDGTFTATHQDGSTTLERSVSTLAPVEGGKHPSTILGPDRVKIRPPMGGGQEAAPEPTMSKKEASYTKRASEDHCGDCSMFRSNACTLVKGYINAGGSCDYFEPQKAGVGAGQEDDYLSTLQQYQQPPPPPVPGPDEEIDPATGQIRKKRNWTDPQTGLPRTDVGANLQDVANLPGNVAGAVGEFFNQLGTTVHDVQPTEEQRQGGVAPPPPERKPIAPTQGPPAPPAENITPESPLPDLTGAAEALQPTPEPPKSTFGPTLQPDNPIMRQARGEPINPLEWNEAVGRAETQTFVPEPIRKAGVEVPVVGRITGEDVGAQVLSPGALVNTVAGGGPALARAGQTVLDEAIGMATQKVLGAAAAKGAPVASKALTALAPALPSHIAPVVEAASDRIAPLLMHLSDSPVGKFLTEDEGAYNPLLYLKGARNVIVSATQGAAAGGTLATVPDLAHPQLQDPNWWGQVIDDFAHGAKAGAVIGSALPVVTYATRYALDRTVGPAAIRGYQRFLNPVMNIPDAVTREAVGTRASGIYLARARAHVADLHARVYLGREGEGLNTAEAAAYVEQNRTLQGFVGKNGETITPQGEAWLQDILANEDRLGAEMRRLKILGKTQDVSTPIGDPGPSVHIMHLYEEPTRAARAGDQRGGLGWHDTVTHQRNKTTDPLAPPDTPRTIRESIDLHTADPTANPKPLDALGPRLSAAIFQSERAIANRQMWNKIRVKRPDAMMLDAHLAPPDWQRYNPSWGYSRQAGNKYAFHPALAEALDNLARVHPTQGWIRDFGEYLAAPLKKMLFSGTPVHLFNLGYRALASESPLQTVDLVRRYIAPTFFRGGVGNLIRDNAALYERAAAARVTFGRQAADYIAHEGGLGARLGQLGAGSLTGFAAGWADAKRRNESNEDALHQGFVTALVGGATAVPGTGKLIKVFGKDVPLSNVASMADVMHHAIFYEALPAAKLGMFDILTKAHPHVPETEIATFVNRTLGGIDSLSMARSPWAQDIMRYSLIASDWTEGQVSQALSLAMPSQQGWLTRRQIVKGLTSYMGFIEALNVATTGHFTWDNPDGKEYQLDGTGIHNGLAMSTGNDDLRAVQRGVPIHITYDVMPPLRGAMEVIGEWARGMEQGLGKAEELLGDTQQGQRLQRAAMGDPTRLEVPPQPVEKTLEYVGNRLGPGVSAIGALGELVRNRQADFTGKPLDKPEPEDPMSWVTFISHAIAPSAPAFAQTFSRKMDVTRGYNQYLGDALAEMLGATRVSRVTPVGENLGAADRFKTWLGIPPELQSHLEESFRQRRKSLDQDVQNAFAEYQDPKSKTTGAGFDDIMHNFSVQRKLLTRRQEIFDDFASKLPEPLRAGVQNALMNVWNPKGLGSERPADVDPDIDPSQLSQGYWAPPQGVDPTNEDQMRKAQNLYLRDQAEANQQDPDALEDLLKWQVQNQDFSSGAVPPMPRLPGVTAGQLSEAASAFLAAGNDPAHPEKPIADVDERADAQRAALKASAAQLGVDPDVLLQRISLRLSDIKQLSPMEKSYNNALQTYFASRDKENFPRFLNADGTPMFTNQDDSDRAELQIKKIGLGMALKLPQWRTLAEAKQRGDNRREKFLIGGTVNTTGIPNEHNLDYEHFFGFGRGMTNEGWKDYASGNLVGYTDLQRDARRGPPRDETIRRDKIQELYRASSPQERIHTRVKVWVNGSYRNMNLWGAYLYTRKFLLNTSGRTLETLAAHDDTNPSQPPAGESTVGDADAEQQD